MADNRQKIVVIAGPTASGKSALAVELSQVFDGEIVNADSMQVYRDMDVGTAKPSIKERMGIPHHMLDVVYPDEDFNAAEYRSCAIPLLREIEDRGKRGFVVGGTGLYIKTLLGGLLICPPTDQGLRDTLYRECEERGSSFLYERLKKLDPESARRIHPNDKIRVIRALEIIKLTEQPLSSLIQSHGFNDRHFRVLKICLQMDREKLYKRINERTLVMMEAGLVRETEDLLGKGYAPDLKPMKSLGYRHMVRFLEGDWDLDKTIHKLQTDTRRYAKRQLTWFRADPDMIWIDPADKSAIVEKIKGFLDWECLK